MTYEERRLAREIAEANAINARVASLLNAAAIIHTARTGTARFRDGARVTDDPPQFDRDFELSVDRAYALLAEIMRRERAIDDASSESQRAEGMRREAVT